MQDFKNVPLIRSLFRILSKIFLFSIALIILVSASAFVLLAVEDYRDDKRLLAASISMIPTGISVFDPVYIEEPNDWDGTFSIIIKLNKDAVEQINAADLAFLNTKRVGIDSRGNKISYVSWHTTPVTFPEKCLPPKPCQGKKSGMCETFGKAFNRTGSYYTFSNTCLGLVVSPADKIAILWFTHT